MVALHTEMTYMSTGDFLANSGWTTLIYNASVARSGVANSILAGHNTVRTKYCHQVTACTLNFLLKKAHDQYRIYNDFNIDFTLWCHEMALKYPQFRYWHTVLKMAHGYP